MGLFAHRPEEPTDWAGIPSEPERDESVAERLPDAPAVIRSTWIGGEPGTSISIPLAPEPDDGD